MEFNPRPFEVIERLKKSELNAQVAFLSDEIVKLTKAFEDTDYKTIKNLQYEKLGKELPYAWEDIDKVAENLRAQINEKEAAISNLLQLKKPEPFPVQPVETSKPVETSQKQKADTVKETSKK